MEIVFSAVGAILLKLLGIVLFLVAFLLLLIIGLICLVLFCPVRYKGAAEYDGNFMAKGKVTWLCSLLSVSFSYQEGKTDSKIRILGIDLLKFLEKRQRNEKDSGEQDSEREKKEKKGRNRDRQQENQPDLQITQIEEPFLGDTIAEDDAKQVVLQENMAEDDAEKPKHGAFFRRIREWLQLPWKKIQGFFQRLRQIFRKIKRKAEWLGQGKEFWKSENTQGMVCILKDNVLHLLRKIRPKVLRGTVFFGTGDPCMTGWILGGAAILYAAYGKGIQIVPDFEEARLEGKLYARGRLFVITILLIVIRIFRSKEWKQFKYDFDQLKEAL